jgi:protein archease
MNAVGEPAPFEVLEHTADIGLRAHGGTLEELFRNACLGLLEIMGATTDDGKDEETVVTEIDEHDLPATLVTILDELVFLVDQHQARIARVAVERDGGLLGVRILWGVSPDPSDGAEIKAATLHQLAVEQGDGAWEATVYFDV